MKKIRVRIAPSPTGDPHVGTAYIALFDYVFAKQNGGDFIIRIEDTDRERYNPESEKKILNNLKWLGLKWDEGPDIGGPKGPYRQSERSDIYIKYGNELLEKGAAYKCYCSQERLTELREEQKRKNLPPGYDGKCRNINSTEYEGKEFVLRLRMPNSGQTVVNDLLRGEVKFENIKMDDQILVKRDGMPTYHLANVVDDHLMEISHIIRAEEWIPSTPKHIALYRAFGWEEPVWIHMPLLRNSNKSKISKRKNDTSLSSYKDRGYLKEALINFLALMGWHPDGTKEIFSVEEMVKEFDFNKVHLGSPILDIDKLNWMNREYIKSYNISKLSKLVLEYFEKDELEKRNISTSLFEKIVEDAKQGINTLEELADSCRKYISNPIDNFNKLEGKDRDKATSVFENDNSEAVKDFFDALNLPTNSLENSKAVVDKLKEKYKPGVIFPLIRLLTTGLVKGPEIAKIIYIFEKDDIIERANAILNHVS